MLTSLLVAHRGTCQTISVKDSIEANLSSYRGDQRAEALYELVYAYLRVDASKAKFYKDVVAKELRAKDPTVAEQTYLEMALGVYYSRSGEMDSALYYLNRAKEFAKAGNLMPALFKLYASLGNVYIASGKPGTALEVMFEGLTLLKNHPDAEMEVKLRTNIAWAYLELKQYRNCIDFGLENIRLAEGTAFDWLTVYTYNNVAVSYGALGFLDSATHYIHKGLSRAQENGDIQSLANGHFILGTIYSNAGKYDLAIGEYLKARPYREKVGIPYFIASDLYTMSDLYFKSGEYKKGIQVGEEALAIAKKHNLQMKFEGAYLSLAQNYEALKDYKRAANYFRLWAIAKDTVYKNANAEAMAEMQTRFETEKKEQQLAIQHAQLAEQRADLQKTYVVIGALIISLVLLIIIFLLVRSRQRRLREVFLREAQIQATIQSQETERRRFAQDLHDGMGQLISALRLTLHTVDKDTTLEDRVKVVSRAERLLNEMHQEIRSIAFNLMPQTLVQNGLVPAIKEMCGRINGSGKVTVRLISFDMPERLSELQEISLYRIVQEWVNNVIKYAHASIIEVQLLGYEDEINVVIDDDGNGFDVAVLDSAKGNGWKNIRSRGNLVRAIIDIDSRVGKKGTTLIIKVPVVRHVEAPPVNTH